MSAVSGRYRIRPAVADDVPAVLALREEASTWLRQAGIEQWTADKTDEIRGNIAAGVTWVAVDTSAGDEVVATITLNGPDLDFWEASDDPDDALYVYKLIVARSHAGEGLGDLMLDWAGDHAARQGKKWLRLDCWRDNTRLHDYYLAHRFDHVRTVVRSWRDSGALFQRAAERLSEEEVSWR